jgi:hypothetical protein
LPIVLGPRYFVQISVHVGALPPLLELDDALDVDPLDDALDVDPLDDALDAEPLDALLLPLHTRVAALDALAQSVQALHAYDLPSTTYRADAHPPPGFVVWQNWSVPPETHAPVLAHCSLPVPVVPPDALDAPLETEPPHARATSEIACVQSQPLQANDCPFAL